MTDWDNIETRRAYLVRVGFSANQVESATDAWVLMMTS